MREIRGAQVVRVVNLVSNIHVKRFTPIHLAYLVKIESRHLPANAGNRCVAGIAMLQHVVTLFRPPANAKVEVVQSQLQRVAYNILGTPVAGTLVLLSPKPSASLVLTSYQMQSGLSTHLGTYLKACSLQRGFGQSDGQRLHGHGIIVQDRVGFKYISKSAPSELPWGGVFPVWSILVQSNPPITVSSFLH